MVARFKDDTGDMELVWFSGHKWIRESLKLDKEYVIFGKTNWFNGKYNMPHPEMELLEDYKKIHFIDDKSEMVDKIKTTFPQVESYFVVRPDDHPYGKQPPACECSDHTVERLSFEISE